MSRDFKDYDIELYDAIGPSLRRWRPWTDASRVEMGDGSNVGERLVELETQIAFAGPPVLADNISARNAISPLIAGTLCYVADASDDPAAGNGPAFYILKSDFTWHMLARGDSPMDPAILAGQGLEVENGHLNVRMSGELNLNDPETCATSEAVATINAQLTTVASYSENNLNTALASITDMQTAWLEAQATQAAINERLFNMLGTNEGGA